MTPGSRNRGNHAHSRKELHKEVFKRHGNTDGVNKRENNRGQDQIGIVEPWTPGSYTALKALLSARLCSAIWGLINDCDETFNYWEPTHYLLYGKGFQTWEYSPEYALRSYTYVLFHAVPAWIYAHLLQNNRMLVFFFIRCLLALFSSACELYFYRGICKEFGANVGRITLGLLVFAAGMFVAATAYLPSSFAMYMTMLSVGAWYHQCPELAIFTTAISTYLGWPFAGILGLPIAWDILFRKKQLKTFLKWCMISTLTILVPLVQIDSQFYGKLVIAPLNIVLYNVFTSRGPELYGTESWIFYFLNGFLNFNFIFAAALVAVPVHAFTYWVIEAPKKSSVYLPTWLSLSPLYLWLCIFVFQPHKEERFLFPVYPLVCLAGAVTVDCAQKLTFAWFVSEKKKHYLQYTNWVAVVVLVVTSLMSLSRIVGQYRAYHAPFEVFMELNRISSDDAFPPERSYNVCIGREWHRFPTSFFMPSLNWNLQFIESDFRGQLPQYYDESPNATAIIPSNMNDFNKEERSRYVPLSACHFIVDLDRAEVTEREPRYLELSDQWKSIYAVPFLDASRSHRLLRAYYIPFLTEKYCTYVNYVLLQSTKWRNKKHQEGLN